VGRHLHLVERFRLLDAETLLYQFEIDDPRRSPEAGRAG
jgi:hypothetical protein